MSGLHFKEVTPYVEDVKWGKYEYRHQPPIMVNLAFVKRIQPTNKKAAGEPLYELVDGSYPSVLIAEGDYKELRRALLGLKGGDDEH